MYSQITEQKNNSYTNGVIHVMFSFLCRLFGNMELEGFKIKVVPLRERLTHIACRLLDNEADAEDVVQEIFLRLWHIRDTLDGYASVEALAVTMTKNLALDKRKARKPHGDTDELLRLDAGGRDPAEQLEQTDAVALIRRLIGQLPSLQQTIIRMKDVEGYELNEIAEITGSTVEAVRSNLSRARKKIREQYLAIIA